jgi:hypothetical protein
METALPGKRVRRPARARCQGTTRSWAGRTGVEGDTLVGEDGASGNVVEVRGIRAVSDELGSNPET